MNYEEAISQLSDEDHARLVADTLYGALLGFTSAGVSPQKAVRAVMVTFLQGVHGPQVWKSLGVPQTTALAPPRGRDGADGHRGARLLAAPAGGVDRHLDVGGLLALRLARWLPVWRVRLWRRLPLQELRNVLRLRSPKHG